MFLVAITSDFAIAPAPILFADAWFLADWVIWVLSVLIGLIGLALALRGLFGDRARGRPHCYKCRYEMTGTQSLTCPECGHVNRSREVLFKTRRYYKRFLVGALLFMFALYCHTGPQVQYRRGVLGEKWWESIVPTTVWIALLPRLDSERVEFVDRRVWSTDPELFIPVAGTRGPDGIDKFMRYQTTDRKSGQIPAWQARWLAQAARAKLVSIRSHPKFQDQDARRLFAWITGVRGQANINDVLIEILADTNEDEGRRAVAASTLGEQPAGRSIEDVLAALVAAASDPSPMIRKHACLGFAQLGPRARMAAATLASSIQAASHREFVDTLDVVAAADERAAACAAMAALIRMEEIDPRPFLPLLYSPDAFLPYQAVRGLKLMAEERRRLGLAPSGIPVQLQPDKLRAPVVEACLAIEAAGGRVGNVPEFDEALRIMFADLSGDDDIKRRNTRDRLLEWREDMLPILYWAARQDDINIHEQCVPFVIFLGKQAADVAPPLVKSMLREPKRLKLLMSELVAYIGPPQPVLLNVLLDALSAADEEARDAANRALIAAQPKPTVVLPLIEERLMSNDVNVRLAMVRRLGEMALSSKDALPVLRAVADKDENAEVRAAAKDALRK